MKLVRSFKNFLPASLSLLALGFIWQITVKIGIIEEKFLPAPTTIFAVLYDFREVIWVHSIQTIIETLIGFAIATLLGIIVAITIFYSSKLRSGLYPILVISQTIPLIALAPLLLIWFGFGLLPKVIVVTLVCFFPIAVATSDGLINAPQYLIDLSKSMGGNWLKTLRYINIPASLDSFFVGLKISAVYAVTGAIIGEYVGAYKGLGVFLQTSASSHAVPLVFAAILVIIFVTLVLLGLIILLQHILMPWKRAGNE